MSDIDYEFEYKLACKKLSVSVITIENLERDKKWLQAECDGWEKQCCKETARCIKHIGYQKIAEERIEVAIRVAWEDADLDQGRDYYSARLREQIIKEIPDEKT